MRTIPVLTPADVRRWDEAAAATGRDTRLLMTAAGRAVAQLIADRWSAEARRGVLVACGSGHNGGDGWAAAQALHAIGFPVWATELVAPSEGAAAEARRDALMDGVRQVAADGPWPGAGLLVDALLGTGATGAPREGMQPLLARLLDLALPLVAIDGPTGLDLANGTQHGDLRATMTITFGGVRRGHLLARDAVGAIVVADIGLGACGEGPPQVIDASWATAQLAPLPARAHKGTRGRVVVIGGMPGMTGAARLAARAAFAAGAGLVHLVAPQEGLAALATAEPDVQTLAHGFAHPPEEPLLELVRRADVVVIGPGLGRAPGREDFVIPVLEACRAAVIDADALHALRGRREALVSLSRGRRLLCTPHFGEFRALFPESANALEVAPWEAARDAAQATGATILLKGVPTVVAGEELWLTVAAGNPGLATGGSGDVLSGICGTLMAQGLGAATAGAVGAQALGEAADHAARRYTARAMRPMDVVTSLPEVWRAWSRARRPLPAPVLWESAAPLVR